MTPTISVAIATFNEAANIKRCLLAVSRWVNEIIIVDGHSTDDTIKIARKFKKVKIYSTTNKPMFHLNKQMAIDKCHSDWILQLDADELVIPPLAKEIQKTIISTTYAGFWIKRQNYFLGKFLTKGGVYPDPTIRLYRRGQGRLPCLSVHEQAKIDGPVGWLENDLQHFADPSFSRYLLRNNRYTSTIAKELQDQKVSLNFINFINYYLFKPLGWFLKTYLRHRGYIDGFPGFVFSLYSALRFPIAYTKYWEMVQTKRELNPSLDWDK